jgi:hypothetical protein
MLLNIRGKLPFSGSLQVIVLRSKSISTHFILYASPLLIAVSLSKSRNVAIVLEHPAISSSISCS